MKSIIIGSGPQDHLLWGELADLEVRLTRHIHAAEIAKDRFGAQDVAYAHQCAVREIEERIRVLREEMANV